MISLLFFQVAQHVDRIAADIAGGDARLLDALGTCLLRSRRRSSVSCGMISRMTWPSLLGVRPRSDFRMAFSMSPMVLRSQGRIISMRGSGTEMPASWFSGVGAP